MHIIGIIGALWLIGFVDGNIKIANRKCGAKRLFKRENVADGKLCVHLLHTRTLQITTNPFTNI